MRNANEWAGAIFCVVMGFLMWSLGVATTVHKATIQYTWTEHIVLFDVLAYTLWACSSILFADATIKELRK